MLMCHSTVDSIISILIEKGFFDKESYEKHRILTSMDIQRYGWKIPAWERGIYQNYPIC